MAAPVVPAFRPNGSVRCMVNVAPEDINFAEMAEALSKIARFNGWPSGPAYSVAQHSVMGAAAIVRETGNEQLGAYFLLHDGHEYLIGDTTRPFQDLLAHEIAAQAGSASDAVHFARAFRGAFAAIKRRIDLAIWQAAGLPRLDRLPDEARMVKAMDDRMLRAEGLALFGPQAAKHLPAANLPAPRLTGAIRAWGPMKAEGEFLKALNLYRGIEARAA